MDVTKFRSLTIFCTSLWNRVGWMNKIEWSCLNIFTNLFVGISLPLSFSSLFLSAMVPTRNFGTWGPSRFSSLIHCEYLDKSSLAVIIFDHLCSDIFQTCFIDCGIADQKSVDVSVWQSKQVSKMRWEQSLYLNLLMWSNSSWPAVSQTVIVCSWSAVCYSLHDRWNIPFHLISSL